MPSETACQSSIRPSMPPWLRVRVPAGASSTTVDAILARYGVRTVCHGAACPNSAACFDRGTATFMILGGTCTRACLFCAVNGGIPGPVELDEPHRVAQAAQAMRLRHVVVTSVTRDDLADGGASHFAAVVTALHRALPQSTVEVLVPDFKGQTRDVAAVLDAKPDVFNHNLETVRRLQHRIRPQADYRRSLDVLQWASDRRPRAWIKSGLMVGLGETDDEIRDAMDDLRAAGCDMLTLGQYLAPSKRHVPVERFVPPPVFKQYEQWARAAGFKAVAAGPLVRSSFQAGRLFNAARGVSAGGDRSEPSPARLPEEC